MSAARHLLTAGLDLAHGRGIFARRVRVLSEHIAGVLPPRASVLDVGCGDGQLAAALLAKRSDLSIEGIDVFVRPETAILVHPFDGVRIPMADRSADVVMFVDVLHHAEDARALLREASRVARQRVVIKDHVLGDVLSGPVLRAMDWVGNARHGVRLPYTYWTEREWVEALDAADLDVVHWRNALGIYPRPVSWVCDRRLHVLATCRPRRGEPGDVLRSPDRAAPLA